MLRTATFLLLLYGGSFGVNLSAQEEPSVKKVISEFTLAWNRHDAKALADLHTEDANAINIFGQWLKGRNEIQATWQKVHAGVFARSKMVMDVDQVKFLAPNIATANGTMELLNVPPDVLGKCHWSRVLVKIDGKWMISEFQNTLIRAGDPARK